jgi:hypothetical protein
MFGRSARLTSTLPTSCKKASSAGLRREAQIELHTSAWLSSPRNHVGPPSPPRPPPLSFPPPHSFLFLSPFPVLLLLPSPHRPPPPRRTGRRHHPRGRLPLPQTANHRRTGCRPLPPRTTTGSGGKMEVVDHEISPPPRATMSMVDAARAPGATGRSTPRVLQVLLDGRCRATTTPPRACSRTADATVVLTPRPRSWRLCEVLATRRRRALAPPISQASAGRRDNDRSAQAPPWPAART